MTGVAGFRAGKLSRPGAVQREEYWNTHTHTEREEGQGADNQIRKNTKSEISQWGWEDRDTDRRLGVLSVWPQTVEQSNVLPPLSLLKLDLKCTFPPWKLSLTDLLMVSFGNCICSAPTNTYFTYLLLFSSSFLSLLPFVQHQHKLRQKFIDFTFMIFTHKSFIQQKVILLWC